MSAGSTSSSSGGCAEPTIAAALSKHNSLWENTRACWAESYFFPHPLHHWVQTRAENIPAANTELGYTKISPLFSSWKDYSPFPKLFFVQEAVSDLLHFLFLLQARYHRSTPLSSTKQFNIKNVSAPSLAQCKYLTHLKYLKSLEGQDHGCQAVPKDMPCSRWSKAWQLGLKKHVQVQCSIGTLTP